MTRTALERAEFWGASAVIAAMATYGIATHVLHAHPDAERRAAFFHHCRSFPALSPIQCVAAWRALRAAEKGQGDADFAIALVIATAPHVHTPARKPISIAEGKR